MRQLANLLKIKQLALPLLAALLFNALVWLIITWRLPISAAWIPLHYNSYFGIDWIGPWANIIYYPLIGLAIIAINTILLIVINDNKNVLSVSLAWSAVVVQLFLITSLLTLIIHYFS
ncbi:MAG TPA: hypothetical protein VJB39_03575 [Patescibacteria group bacterium]|nr:hypothetical protein [Patescibacteria group bacterium]